MILLANFVLSTVPLYSSRHKLQWIGYLSWFLRKIPSWRDGTWRNGIMSVVLMGLVDGGRILEIHGGVGISRIILGIQIELSCLAVSSLLNRCNWFIDDGASGLS